MTFYKRTNDELLSSPAQVTGPGFDLSADNHSIHTYPVDGWYWFDGLDAALTFFAGAPAVAEYALTKYEFLNRFTQAERVAIRAAATTNPDLYDFMQMLEISGEVQLNNPSTQAGVAFLEAAGLIGPGRSAEILNY